MKVSLIATVLNEENSIKKFLDSVNNQTTLPYELIVVDGVSSDRTVIGIKDYLRSIKRFKIRLIAKKGNRSVGRNAAIKNSTGDIIAVSDAGCILDKNWLKNMTKPFQNQNISIVSGFYRPVTSSVFEKSLSTYTCVMPDKIDTQTFLPSSRSVAFRKRAWEKVGGYPEELDTCEDLIFDQKLKKAGLGFQFVKKAVVYWPQRKNIFQAFLQFLNYAIGDGQAFYIRPQTPLVFARYLTGITMVIIYLITRSNVLLLAISYSLLAYLVWSIWKNYKYVKHFKAFLYLPVLQLTSDLAVIFGMNIGIAKRLMRQ